jgi:hypothetical protein
MVICPQCNIEHDEGEEFCKTCGKFLLSVEEPPSQDQYSLVKLTCPKCQLSYAKGNYCRKCGSLLMRGTPPQEMDVQPLEKKLVKKWTKEWLRMSQEEKELKTCMEKLETQREKISGDVYHPISTRYKNQLDSLYPLHQEIETELKSIRKRATEEIDFLDKELKPIQKRYEEFQSLYKLGAITKADFAREKKEMRREIKFREKNLRKHRHILSLLPSKMGGRMTPSGLTWNLLQPFPLMGLIAMLILIGVGGYVLLKVQSHEVSTTHFKETPLPLPPPPSPSHAQASVETEEVEKIRSLFESIRMANLQKDIDLFMSCFSRDFKGRDGKRMDALKMWENYNYLNLSYELKNKSISGDTSNIQLEWLVKTSQKRNGKIQEGKTLLDVTLKREDGLWKIKEIKTVS